MQDQSQTQNNQTQSTSYPPGQNASEGTPSTTYPQTQQQNTQQTPQENQQPASPTPPAKKAGFLKIILVIVAIFIVIGIVFFAFRLVSNRVGQTIDSNKPVEITWWGLWEDSSIVDSVIAQYQEANPNVTINYQRQSADDYRERLSNALARGDGPDIFRIHNTWIPMFRSELSPLPPSVMSQEEYEQTFYRVALESALTNQGILAIPLQFDALGLFINEEIFSTFAKTVPENWEELRQTAIDLTIIDSQTDNLRQAGIALGLTENVDYWENIIGLMMIQNRASLTEPSGAQARGAINFYQQFVRQDGVWENAQADSVAAFTTGRVAMIFAPSSVAHQIRRQNPSLEFRVAPVPQLTKNNPDDPNITYASFWMEGVSAKSDASQQSWEFLKYLTQSQNLEKLYQNASESRSVYPEIYPRIDMRDRLLADKYVGGIVRYAPTARFWYLAANTNDGETGLNSQLAEIFRSKLQFSTDAARELENLGTEVRALLARYGLAQPLPVIEE